MSSDLDRSSSHVDSRAETPGSAGETRALPLPHYFEAKQLTKQPKLIDDLDGMLGDQIETGFRGRLLLRLFLSASGHVDRVQVIESTMPQEIEGMIVKTFYVAHYQPGEIEGEPVMSEMTVEIGVATEEAIGAPAANHEPARARQAPASRGP